MVLTKKEKRELFLGLFILPVLPSLILWQKVSLSYLVALFFICWGCLFISFFSQNFSVFLFNSARKIAKKIGEVLSVIALIFVYIIAIIPTGFLTKLVGRDRLLIRKQALDSYWKKFEYSADNYETQF